MHTRLHNPCPCWECDPGSVCGLCAPAPELPLWRAMFTRGADLFTWWDIRAAGPVEAVELARTIDHYGTLVEVVQVEEVEL